MRATQPSYQPGEPIRHHYVMLHVSACCMVHHPYLRFSSGVSLSRHCSVACMSLSASMKGSRATACHRYRLPFMSSLNSYVTHTHTYTHMQRILHIHLLRTPSSCCDVVSRCTYCSTYCHSVQTTTTVSAASTMRNLHPCHWLTATHTHTRTHMDPHTMCIHTHSPLGRNQ